MAVRTADPGEARAGIAAVEITLDDFPDHGPEMPVLPLEPPLVFDEEPLKMMEQHTVEHRALRMARAVDNAVVIRGFNDDEAPDFVGFGEREKIEVRFIELMPTSGLSPECKELGTWRPALFVKGAEIRAHVEEVFGPLVPMPGTDGVAEVFRTRSGGRIGFITPVSDPFCAGCGRLRLGPGGRLKLCLFDKGGLDVRRARRKEKAGPVEIEALLRAALETKTTWDRVDLKGLQSDMFKVGG